MPGEAAHSPLAWTDEEKMPRSLRAQKFSVCRSYSLFAFDVSFVWSLLDVFIFDFFPHSFLSGYLSPLVRLLVLYLSTGKPLVPLSARGSSLFAPPIL